MVDTAKFAPGCDMTLLTVIQFLVAGLLGLAAGLALEPMPNFAALGADTWTSLAYLAVFASCVALLLQNLAVAHVDPAPASLFLATESVFGVLFSVLFLGELLSAPLFAGFALIFAGIVVSEYLPQRAARKADAGTDAQVGSQAESDKTQLEAQAAPATERLLPNDSDPLSD